MYFIKETKNSLIVLIKIKQKIYIVKNLKMKLLIKINILSSELINIYILKKKIYLKTYKVIILIEIYFYRILI